MVDHPTRRAVIAGLGGVMTTSFAGCAAFEPESNLRSVAVGLRNDRSIPAQVTLTFADVPEMVVPAEDTDPTWRVTAPAGTEVFEDHQAQPTTYEPQIEVSRLGNDSDLYAEQHELRVPEPRGSRTTVDIHVTESAVNVDIQPHIAV